jgi:hypothetical protein
LSQGYKIRGIDEPRENVQGYLVQGLFIMASTEYTVVDREASHPVRKAE